MKQFDESELQITGEIPGMFGGPGFPLYNFPITPKESYKSLFNNKPIWQITGIERKTFTPKVNPDNVARAFVFDGTNTPPSGGTDMFGIEWEYVPQVGGSMVRPGKPFLNDANEWYEKVVWPDIESWDWESCAKANVDYLNNDLMNGCIFMNGWYERLISFMDFEGAVVAMIDDEQQDAVKDFFDKLSDLYIQILEKYLTYFPEIDFFIIHDDWGSQKETFFSPETAAEMLVPYMKRVTDYLHSKGKPCELHSCGQLIKQVPNFIAAGWDTWTPQPMNDTQKIYELYGDRIIIPVIPDPFNPETASEQEQRAFAKRYAEQFCISDKPSTFNFYAAPLLTPAFREELYRQSRICYNA
ncbi:MAG: uroporphyrinogen decarboxylase family protein [Anaerofustis sp.]